MMRTLKVYLIMYKLQSKLNWCDPMSSKGRVAPAYPLGHKWIAGVQTAWMRAGNHATHKRPGTSMYTGYRQSMPV
jgi:hypothetical protein